MNYELISVGVVLMFACLGGAAFLKRRPDWLLMLLVVGLGFGGFNVYSAGTIWTPKKIVTAFGLFYILLENKSWRQEIKRSESYIIWLVLGSVLASVLVAYFLEPVGGQIYDSNLQGRSLRPLVQAYSYISEISIFPLALLSLKCRKKIEILFDIYIWTALVVSFIAIYQLIVLQTGGSFMPILRAATGRHSEQAAFVIAGIRLQRLYAFAGEPKTLAVFLLPAVFAVLSSIIIKVPIPKPSWAKIWILIPLIFVYFFTFSSAGIIALALGLIFIGIILNTFQSTALARIAILFIAIFFSAQIMSQYLFNSTGPIQPSNSINFYDIFYQRSLGRIADEFQSRYEYVALDVIWNKYPYALPFGLGLGMYNFYIGGLHYGGGVEPIDSGWIVLLLDTGLIGLFFVLYWLYGVVRRGLRMTVFWAIKSDWKAFLLIAPAMASLAAGIFLHLGTDALESIVLFAGVTEATRVRLK